MATDTVAAVGQGGTVDATPSARASDPAARVLPRPSELVVSDLSPSSADPTIEQAVYAEQIRVLYKRGSAALIAVTVTVAILVGILWPAVDHSLLVGWAAAMGAITLVRFFVWRSYRRRAPPVQDAPRWARYYLAGVVVSGLGFGATALTLYVPGQLEWQLLVVFVVGGICAGAVGSTSSYLPALYAYIVCSLMPLAMRLALDADAQHLGAAGLTVLFALAMGSFGRSGHRALSESARLRFENGDLVGELQVVRDRLAASNEVLEQRVTERTTALGQANESLRQQHEERERLQEQLLIAHKLEALGKLTGGIAHDFNNVLSVIASYASFVRDGLREDDPVREDVEVIHEATRRATSLTGQLLAFSRKQVRKVRVVDVNEVVTSMDKMLRRLIGDHIELVTKTDPELGSVAADVSQLEQIVMNLVVNARDAMPTGGTLLMKTANVTLERGDPGLAPDLTPGQFVMLSVTDTGCGMDQATCARIFEPFFTTKELGRGTGLGLATTFGIVKQSGGSIVVDSQVGRGTSFNIYLPWSDRAPRSTALHEAVGAARSGGETVLVVDDQQNVRQAVSRILESAGYRVLSASRGEQACEVCSRHDGSIELLLTDVIMPGDNGLELFAKLTVKRPEMRVLFMSGHVDDAVVDVDALRDQPFIAKPFVPAALLAALREALT